MFVTTIPNHGSKPTILVRESYRENGKNKSRTLANLTKLPPEVIETVRQALAGETMLPLSKTLTVEETLPAGHVRAVLGTMKKLGIPELLASRPSHERNLILGMIVERILHPTSKLGTVRLWKTSTLASELSLEDTDANQAYAALDWLYERQERIEGKLAAKHLNNDSLVLYDLSNSLYESHTNPLAQIGRDKEGRHGALLISYGVLTDREGRPIAIEVYPGNTNDTTTVADQVEKLRGRFGLEQVVLVGDRGTITGTRIAELRQHPGLGWLSALRSDAIRKLVDGEVLQLSLFDKRNLAEIKSDDFPGERLVACFNPLLAEERARKREDLLQATERSLGKIRKGVESSRNKLSDGKIGQRVGRVINQYKVGKHFTINIADGIMSYERNAESIRREAELDGVYVIRTNAASTRLSAEDTVRGYKSLAQVEQNFRGLKSDLEVQPIYLRTDSHVRAHFFICMLAYYVTWHMRRALAPILFQDAELPELRPKRDPVTPATISQKARSKKARGCDEDGIPLQSWETLWVELATYTRVRYKIQGHGDASFTQYGNPTPTQQKAFQLLGV